MRLLSVLIAVATAALASVPADASAGRRDGRYASRARVRDHRPYVRPYRPYVHHHHYWPHHYYYGYGPYYGYAYDGYYYGPPAAAPVVAPAPRPRTVVGLAVHLGQLETDDDVRAGIAGLALRLRGTFVEGEIEIGRRAYEDSDVVDRSLAGTVYLNLGDRDAFHPYLLAGAGFLEGDRMFGAIGAGLALPVASRLTLAGDLRAASIGERDHEERMVSSDRDERTVEGRLTLVVDF